MYRKLNDKELNDILQKLLSKKRSQDYPRLFELVTKYYGNGKAYYAVISFDSEYNDEGYDNKFKSITVYDVNDNLVPIKRSAYDEFTNEVDRIDFGESQSEECMEDILVHFNFVIPDLYVKE